MKWGLAMRLGIFKTCLLKFFSGIDFYKNYFVLTNRFPFAFFFYFIISLILLIEYYNNRKFNLIILIIFTF